MCRGLLFVALLALAGCIFPPKEGTGTGGGGGGGGGGGAGGEAGTGSSDGAAGDAATVGTMCTIPTTGGAMLCEGVSACPKLSVNQTTFMGCGFIVVGKAYNLVCECSGYLCPAPPTTTCAAAALILEQESANQICYALNNGGCNQEFLPPGTVSDSGLGTPKCDPSCTSQCVGDPTCLTGCGC